MRARFVALGLGFALMASLSPRPAAAAKVYGAVILDESRKIEPGRYRSMKSYERTLRYFRSVYGRTKGVVFRPMKTTPKVKGVHIANLRSKRTWDGINVYEVRDKTFIYVIKHDPGTALKK